MNVTTELNTHNNIFVNAIQDAIKEQIKLAVEEAVARASEELKTKIPIVVSGISLKLAKHISIQSGLQNDLVIHVKLDGLK